LEVLVFGEEDDEVWRRRRRGLGKKLRGNLTMFEVELTGDSRMKQVNASRRIKTEETRTTIFEGRRQSS
jgi:hypothetical protein